jgi:ketosteroid isomerase-like protein
MSSAPKHTPRSVLEAFYAAELIYMSAAPEERDFSDVAATLSSDCHLEQTSGLPYAGVYKGKEGMLAWAEQMANYFDTVDVQDREFFEREGSDRIVVVSNVKLRVRATGEELKYPFCQVMTVDLEKGVITELRPFYWDVHHLNKAIGYKHTE